MNISGELSKFEVGSKESIFLEKVLAKLGPNLVRKSVEDNLREAHNNLNKAIQRYFESYIISDAIIKSSEQLETSQETVSSIHSLNKLPSKDVHPVYLNFVQKYLPSENLKSGLSPKFKPFGLCQENSLNTVVENKKLEAKTLAFQKLVEKNIKDFYIKLIKVVTNDTVFPGSEWQNAFNRTMKDLESKSILLSCEETKEPLKRKLNEMIKTYYKELDKNVLLSNKLLSLHILKLEFESNFTEFYLHRCQALSLKARLCQQKLLEETYNQETIPALKKISAQLELSEQKLKEEENEKTVALEQYLKLGEEYEHYVDEYANLLKSIKEEQWAIDNLKSKQALYETSDHI